MLDLQMKLKQDNDEMLSSLNDLNNWEQEIKEKEKYLLEGEPKKNYPIRNNVLKSIKKNFPYSNKDKNVNSISQKIKGDDYKAWESYDDVCFISLSPLSICLLKFFVFNILRKKNVKK